MARQAALAFMKRTLDRCRKYEDTGKSCFSEPLFKDIFISGFSNLNDARHGNFTPDGESTKSYASIRYLEGRISDILFCILDSSGQTCFIFIYGLHVYLLSILIHCSKSLRKFHSVVPLCPYQLPMLFSFFFFTSAASIGLQQSPSQLSQNVDNHDIISQDVLVPLNHISEQTAVKEDTWSNRVKKRELSLDDVGGTAGTSNAPSVMGSSLSSSAKGKRSERDRDGKGHNREVLSRNGTAKIGRPALSNVKGERKSKTKPKQKTTQLSVSVNGLLGKMSEQPKPALPSVSKSSEMTSSSKAKGKDHFGFDALDGPESIDFSKLPGMDVLGVPDELDGQAGDLGSWLSVVDDDGLQDIDFMGLEIPMDDLSDLNMMV